MPRLEELREQIDAGKIACLKREGVHLHVCKQDIYKCITLQSPCKAFGYTKWESLLCREPALTITCSEWRVL